MEEMLANAMGVGMLPSLDVKLLHDVGMIIVSGWSWVTTLCPPTYTVISIADSLVVLIAVRWKSLMYQHGSAHELNSRRSCMHAGLLAPSGQSASKVFCWRALTGMPRSLRRLMQSDSCLLLTLQRPYQRQQPAASQPC